MVQIKAGTKQGGQRQEVSGQPVPPLSLNASEAEGSDIPHQNQKAYSTKSTADHVTFADEAVVIAAAGPGPSTVAQSKMTTKSKSANQLGPVPVPSPSAFRRLHRPESEASATQTTSTTHISQADPIAEFSSPSRTQPSSNSLSVNVDEDHAIHEAEADILDDIPLEMDVLEEVITELEGGQKGDAVISDVQKEAVEIQSELPEESQTVNSVMRIIDGEEVYMIPSDGESDGDEENDGLDVAESPLVGNGNADEADGEAGVINSNGISEIIQEIEDNGAGSAVGVLILFLAKLSTTLLG